MSTDNGSASSSATDLPRDSRQPNLIACAVITWLASGIFVGLRLYTRRILINVLGPTDWCILAAWIFSAGVTASVLEEVYHGLGLHAWNFDFSEYIEYARAGWYQLVFYFLALCLTKVSILLLYLHIFSFHWVRVAAKVVLAVVVLSNLYIMAVVFTACVPLKAFWDYTLRGSAYCQPNSMWWSNTGLHMSTDFLIWALPLPIIGSLRLPRREKVVLLGLFAMGFFVCFVSILRLWTAIDSEEHPSSDFFYDQAILTYWTLVEVNTAILCACTMTLKPLVGKWLPAMVEPPESGFDGRDPYSADGAGPPLTVGSKPSRGQLRVRTSYDSWLRDFRDFPRKPADVQVVALNDGLNRENTEARPATSRQHQG
ncbi:hypothetical protein NKR23_g6711 [Pleurostoma richardsiae]|uniref:Rhodopsin domain-containing protein n=1 Tax=Pleurostoma richardsiae TaxID=41990 RepID=A0AA38RCR6_9PEZI|nr:hypothetical protein NKR23_g6711 [Pleurostoma richardsiae]